MARVTQLRMYTIHEGKMEEWLSVFRNGVVPAREQVGFTISGAWVVPEENTFIWLMSYDGDDWAERDAAYFASPARKAITPDPATFIKQQQHWMMTPVPV